MSDGLDDIRETFFQECADLLEALEAGLIEMRAGDADPETVNAVFRAVHSIKGGAGAFGYSELVGFAHDFETVLDTLRTGRREAAPDLLDDMLAAADQLADLVAVARTGAEADATRLDASRAALAAWLPGAEVPPPAEAEPEESFDTFGFEPMALDLDLGSEREDAPATCPALRIRFEPGPQTLHRGGDPALVLRELEALGEVEATLDGRRILDADPFDPRACLAAWTLRTVGISEVDAREVFEFVEGDSVVEIVADEEEFEPPEPGPDDENTVEGFVPAPIALDLPGIDSSEAPEPEVEPEQALAAPEPPAPAPSVSAPKPRPAPPASETIRVDLAKVDTLINLVGELVINQSMLAQAAGNVPDQPASLSEGLDAFRGLTRDLQESVMAMRAQPVRTLFQRMSRVVREAASATGKRAVLEIEGEGTEIDRTVIEQLADPLTHILRNAVDHGLEAPEGRSSAGKADDGRIKLSASHRSGRVLIEISDDGAGINRERVRAIAEERGLVSPGDALSPTEVDNLIFRPGFSTAETVSDLSGRGVGMDVVQRAIQKLGGRVSIQSEPGAGSRFSLSLPLTLALLDGMLVTVAGQTLVVPLTAVCETIRPDPGAIHRIPGGQGVNVRGRILPITSLEQALGLTTAEGNGGAAEGRVLILIGGEDGPVLALAVDDIFDQRQVVIKSLEENYAPVPGVSAATILGDGSIALILDTDALLSGAGHPNPLRGEVPHAA